MEAPVIALYLGAVHLPTWHPRAADKTCELYSFAIRHPDGIVLVDTGCGSGNAVIDELYAPDVVDIIDALNDVAIDERDVVAVVNTHLHFDHCGQNSRFPSTPIWVQQAEVDAATEPYFTVPEWCQIDQPQLRVAGDIERIVDGVTIIATPGHTPGHQSVMVESGDSCEVIAGQVCYTCAEFANGKPVVEDMHDESFVQSGIDSIKRLVDLAPDAVYFSHDPTVYLRGQP